MRRQPIIMTPTKDIAAKIDKFTVEYDQRRADDLRRYLHLQWCSTVMTRDDVLNRVFDENPGLLDAINTRMESLRISLGFQS